MIQYSNLRTHTQCRSCLLFGFQFGFATYTNYPLFTDFVMFCSKCWARRAVGLPFQMSGCGDSWSTVPRPSDSPETITWEYHLYNLAAFQPFEIASWLNSMLPCVKSYDISYFLSDYRYPSWYMTHRLHSPDTTRPHLPDTTHGPHPLM